MGQGLSLGVWSPFSVPRDYDSSIHIKLLVLWNGRYLPNAWKVRNGHSSSSLRLRQQKPPLPFGWSPGLEETQEVPLCGIGHGHRTIPLCVLLDLGKDPQMASLRHIC